jgi:hypothetical protein
VLPFSRASMRYSIAWNVPSVASPPRYASRFGGSHPVIVDCAEKSPILRETLPPSPGSTWCGPMNHESIPGPVAIASHTCSRLASSSVP